MASRMILLAEEDPAIAGFLADNLVADGYTVLVADDKPAALELLETRAPDLVLCDVNGDTLGLLHAIRQADGLASPVPPDPPIRRARRPARARHTVDRAHGARRRARACALLRPRLRRRDRKAVLL